MTWLVQARVAMPSIPLVRTALLTLMSAACLHEVGRAADDPLHNQPLPPHSARPDPATTSGDSRWVRIEHGEKLAMSRTGAYTMPDLVTSKCSVIWTKLQRFPNTANVFLKWDPLAQASDGTIVAQAPKPGDPVGPTTRVFIRLAGGTGVSGPGSMTQICAEPGSPPAAAPAAAAVGRRASSHPPASPIEPPQAVRADAPRPTPQPTDQPAPAVKAPAGDARAGPGDVPIPGPGPQPGPVSVASRAGRDGVLVAYPADWLFGVRRDGRVIAWPPQGWITRTGPDGWLVPYPGMGWTSQTGPDGRIVPYPNAGWNAVTGTDGRVVPYPAVGWKATAGPDGRIVPYPGAGWTTAVGKAGRLIAFPVGGRFKEGTNGQVEIFDSQGRATPQADALALRAKLVRLPISAAQSGYVPLLLDQMGFGTVRAGARAATASAAMTDGGAAPASAPATWPGGPPTIGPHAVPPLRRVPALERGVPRS